MFERLCEVQEKQFYQSLPTVNHKGYNDDRFVESKKRATWTTCTE